MTDYGQWVADSSSGGKFWSISIDGSDVTTKWGKVGSGGSSNTKSFPTAEKAEKFVASTIAKKEKEGYVKSGGGGGAKKASAASKKRKDEDEDDDDDEEEKKPKTKKAAAPKKAAAAAAPKKAAGKGSSVFDGLVFCITGKLSNPRAHYEALIAANGGSVAKSLTKAVTHVISSRGEKETSKLTKARENGVAVLTEEFLADAIEDGEVPASLDAYQIDE